MSIGVGLLSVQDVALLPVSVKSAVVSRPALSVTLSTAGVRMSEPLPNGSMGSVSVITAS